MAIIIICLIKTCYLHTCVCVYIYVLHCHLLVLVNFSTDSIRTGVNAKAAFVHILTYGVSDYPFYVKVIPNGTNKGTVCMNGTNTIAMIYILIILIAKFFDDSVKSIHFRGNRTTAQVSMRLFLKPVRQMNLQFTVRLVVPAVALSQGVVLGEPNVVTVTVPHT